MIEVSQAEAIVSLICAALMGAAIGVYAMMGRPRGLPRPTPTRDGDTVRGPLLAAYLATERLNEAMLRLAGRWWLHAAPGGREVRLCDEFHHRRPTRKGKSFGEGIAPNEKAARMIEVKAPASNGARRRAPRDPGPPPNQGSGGSKR